MIADYQEVIRDVSGASNLTDALATLVRRIRSSVPVDAFAIYLAGTESGEYVLKASDGAGAPPAGLVRSGAQTGLLGLVGERQELIVLNNATAHPRYAPAIETGGRQFDTFIGVPLIHYHETLGVLVAWKQAHRQFDKEEISFFVTIAAQLARVIYEVSNGDFVIERLRNGAEENGYVQGAQAANGVAIGNVMLIDPLAILTSVPDRPAEDMDAEEIAFQNAVLAVQAELAASSERLADVLPSEVREMFDVYIMLLGSDSLTADTRRRIRAGNWAPGAWRDTVAEHARVFDRMEDPCLRARGEDIRELGRRVLAQLQPGPEDPCLYSEQCILVGDAVSIQDIASVPSGQLAGIVSHQGSAFSHTAIVANALGIPAVVSLSSLPAGLVNGARVLVDGDEARIYVNPSRPLLDAFAQKISEHKALSTQYMAYRDLPAQTVDGFRLHLYANIGLESDIDLALREKADGVGLHRTEYQFLLRDNFPVEEEQFRCYRKLLESFAPKPVTIRTLDLGADKILPYFPMEEHNPSLGVRGIRFSLAHPEIFMIQLRALLRANAGLGNLRVLFPMIAKVCELDEALALLARASHELKEESQAIAKPQVGVMIEVPSAVFLTRILATRVDFLSIGTNDLTQYILAADRTNARVTTRDDSLHPAVLNAINMIIGDAHAHIRTVSVCGEVAGDAAGALVLLGMGIDSLSMSPTSFGRVKMAMRGFTLKRAQALADEALGQEDECQVRSLLNDALGSAGVLQHPPLIEDPAEADAGALAG